MFFAKQTHQPALSVSPPERTVVAGMRALMADMSGRVLIDKCPMTGLATDMCHQDDFAKSSQTASFLLIDYKYTFFLLD
jgi:hypothetical protein